MTALAAARLGYRCHVFCPEPDAPAAQVTPLSTCAAYDDEVALAGFAEAVDVVTFEFENIPRATAETLASRVPLRPRPEILGICQNRLREKDFCTSVEVPTTRYAAVGDREALTRVVRDIAPPCVLKTAELGYDGKGQALINSEADLDAAWNAMAGHHPESGGIVESFVDFRMEISVVVARSVSGDCRAYPVTETQHRDHILDQTIVPARVEQRVAERAEGIARHLAERLDLIGVLAVEMFVTAENEVLVNELAPRPHNSGHWTIDACLTSQFEQLVRAVAGLPLGACPTRRPSCTSTASARSARAARWATSPGWARGSEGAQIRCRRFPTPRGRVPGPRRRTSRRTVSRRRRRPWQCRPRTGAQARS
jgi:5-(carboxyamino)imidazole ribonucleotide synthase